MSEVDNDAENDRRLTELGTLLAAARKSLGMSVRDVAAQVGLSEQYVRMIEAGHNPRTKRPSRPAESKLLGLARAVGVDPAPWFALAGYDAPDLDAAEQPARGSVKDYAQRLTAASRHFSDRSPIVQRQAMRRLEKATLDFERATKLGTVEIPADEEPLLTQEAAQECRFSLKAVSFQDDEWWNSADGAAYLNIHRDLKVRGVEMTRIFLVSGESQASLGHTLREHLEIGIRTYALSLDLIDNPEDFVIYDEQFVRRASSIDPEDLNVKDATLHDDQVEVRLALRAFEHLYRQAEAYGGRVTAEALAEYEASAS